MSITTVNAAYQATAPTKTGQVIASTLSGNDAVTLKGNATITGDGATQTAVVNFVDGTQLLGFTPGWMDVAVIPGGTDTTANVVGVTAFSTTSFSVKFNPAISNGLTCKIAFEVAK